MLLGGDLLRIGKIMTRLRNCPNCKQNVVPTNGVHIAWGYAALLFFFAAGITAFSDKMLYLDDSASGVDSIMLMVSVAVCMAWWCVGAAVFAWVVRNKRRCPICRMPDDEMGKAL